MQILGMLTSRNFAGISIMTSEISPENFRSISQRLAFLHNNLQNAEKAGILNTERPIKCNLGHVSSPNLLVDVMSSIYRHCPSFKSFWQVGLKKVFHSGQTRALIFKFENLVCIVLLIGFVVTVVKNILLCVKVPWLDKIFVKNHFPRPKSCAETERLKNAKNPQRMAEIETFLSFVYRVTGTLIIKLLMSTTRTR